MTKYDQDDTSNSIDELTKKMESYFMSTQEEIKKLRTEIAELTRLLKAQRVNEVVIKRIGAPSIADMITNKALDI